MLQKTAKVGIGTAGAPRGVLYRLRRDRQLLIILLPCLVFYLIFRYGPMYGVIVAFEKYDVFSGILHSPWVGLKYFREFFGSHDFFILFRNTLLLGMYSLIWSTPFPILFALLLNEAMWVPFKKTVQTISILPSFLSTVIVASIVIDFLSPSSGFVNRILSAVGFEKIYFMIKPEWFRTVYIGSGIWQGTGYSSIIYLAAIANISPVLYEAARMDGCGRVGMMWHITIPGMMPTIVTLFILSAGSIIKVGFEKVLLLYNPATYSVADIFSTYVYRKGLVEMNLSYATAAGTFEALVSFSLLVMANKLSKWYLGHSLW